jgi:hypothetical protein
MRRSDVLILVTASILIISLLVTAGCTSIPGPEPRQTHPVEKTPVPVTPQARTLAIKTATPSPTLEPANRPVTVQVTPATTPHGTYELRTCAQQGGGTAQPGDMCPGTWLAAADTFSCCSVIPAMAIDRNTTISIEPLDLVIVIDDNPGNIIP